MSIRIIYPTQLFDVKHKESKITLVLDPVFFSGPDGSFRIHKAKLVYMLAASLEYAKMYNLDVCYPNDTEQFYASIVNVPVIAYPPMDRYIEKKLHNLKNISFDTHPGFVIDPYSYNGPIKLTPIFKAARDITGIIVGVKSKDKYNRVPPNTSFVNEITEYEKNTYIGYSDLASVQTAISYVEKHHSTNFGNIEGYRYFPFTRKDALIRLREYCKRGIFLMKYQDAIVKGKQFLGHSVLSAAINIGILSPLEVCISVVKSGASESDIEGFVRQILGWREMMAIIYVRRTRKLDLCFSKFPKISSKWYDGTTTLTPFDDTVSKAYNTGYLHHIERLMISLNALVLMDVGPGSAYRWFMEVVSIDAYDWVMIGNLSSMGYSKETGTNFASKPYISSSSYISRMSIGFENDEDWKDKWDGMFYAYIKRKDVPYFRHVLKGRRYLEKEKEWKRIHSTLSASLRK
jgi:hypothetical protein